MSKYFRYPTIINDNIYKIIIGVNSKHYGETILIEKKDIPDNYKLENNKNYIIRDNFVIHNFTVFKDKNNDFYYGLGGLIRDQEPYNSNEKIVFRYYKLRQLMKKQNKKLKIDLDTFLKKEKNKLEKKSGIFLYKSYDLKNWKKINKKNPIISSKFFPKNAKISIESICPEFDSNISCFYSQILKKYILFCRANIARGCRSVQFTTTQDFKTWKPFQTFNIDSFKKYENYYMFKCVELVNHKLFFGLAPYTNKPDNPTKYYVKKIVSFDAKNWLDCGKLCAATMHQDKIHLNTHVGEIIYNNDYFEIYLFENCFEEKPILKKHIIKIDKNLEIVDFIKKMTV